MMYNEYLNYITSITESNISTSNFKSKSFYNEILEHVSIEQGIEYLNLVSEMVKNLYPEISFKNIKDYLFLNDKYGEPTKHTFTFYDGSTVSCSPTSLRYIYHSLLILHYYKLNNNSTSIVEVGCGYGGLFLGICYFSKILNIAVDHYYFIDLPEITNLIKNYISLHTDNVNISYSVHSGLNYGKEIENNNLFLVSNYCFTEIEKEHRDKYIDVLFPKVTNGFIIWQTCFGLPVQQTYIINKRINKIDEELPQTANAVQKNYFVYF